MSRGVLAVIVGLALLAIVGYAGVRNRDNSVRVAAPDAGRAAADERQAVAPRTAVVQGIRTSDGGATSSTEPPDTPDENFDEMFAKADREHPTEQEHVGEYTIARATRSGRVFVSLEPGREIRMPFDDESRAVPPGPRDLRGRVLQADGAPIAGAVVLVSADGFHTSSWTGFDGQDATSTTNDGSYQLAQVSADAFNVIALHPTAGWTLPIRVPAGRDDVTLDLVVAPSGRITGRVSRAHQPVRGRVWLGSEDRRFGLAADCAADGTYAFALVPPGAYRIAATALAAADENTGEGRWFNATLTVAAGAGVTHDFELPTGVTVRFVVDAGDRPVRWVTTYFASGALAGTTEPELEAALHAAGARAFVLRLVGGEEESVKTSTYYDLDPGNYTMCVAVRFEGQTPDDPAAIACVPARVAASPAEQVFAIPLP